MFVGYVIATSKASADFKASAKRVISPSTALLYEAAHKEGWVHRGDAYTPPGSLFIIPGRHVGFVWEAYHDGTFLTLEGNSANGVRSNRRAWDDGWEAITIPRTGNVTLTKLQTGYGFDDLRVKLYGGWETKTARDKQLTAFRKANPDAITQAVRVKKRSPYAFRAAPKGTNLVGRYGPWIGENAKQRRDDAMAAWEKANKTTARPWRSESIPGGN